MNAALPYIVAGLLLAFVSLYPQLRRSLMACRMNVRLHVIAPRAQIEDGSKRNRFSRFESVLVTSATDRVEIATALQAAGWHQPQALLVFGSIRLLGALLAGFAVVGFLLAADEFSGRAQIYPLLAGGLVYLLAKHVLKWRAKERQRRVSAEMPVLLDLLLLMIESGVSLDRCFLQIAQIGSTALPETVHPTQRLVDDIEQGVSYEIALERWGERLGISGARELARMFRQSLLHGAEVASGLREFTREFSDKRLTAARESIGIKAAQLSGAMMLFFMPALFILLGGPAATALLNAMGSLR